MRIFFSPHRMRGIATREKDTRSDCDEFNTAVLRLIRSPRSNWDRLTRINKRIHKAHVASVFHVVFVVLSHFRSTLLKHHLFLKE